MKARQAVVCPKCGALNRPTWEFCARCNESLEGALAAQEGVSTTDSVEETHEGAAGIPAGAIAFVTLVALLGLGAAAWRHASTAPPASRPDPSLFTAPSTPMAL